MTDNAAQSGNGATRSGAPVLAASWRTPGLDTAAVHDELDRLWAQLHLERHGSALEGAGAMMEGAVMRASTLNLIAVAPTVAAAAEIEATLGQLTEFSPSRALILVSNAEEAASDGLEVRAAVHEQGMGRGRPAIRFEAITIVSGAKTSDSLASLTAPLLVPELPDFLWWPRGPIAGSPLFGELIDMVDRLIVDSGTLPEPADSLRVLAGLVGRPRSNPKLSDFAWDRLLPWRQMIAQFFDPPAAQSCLDCIDEVTVIYGGTDERGHSGLTCALLAVGWLASRLGWQAPGELVRYRDGWRVTLRAGRPGRRREVILTLRPTAEPCARSCLSSVELNASGHVSGSFTVHRVDDVGVTTTSETSSMPKVSRMVYVKSYDDATLLGQGLRMFGRDRVFEEALVFAATLLPEGSVA